MPFWAVGIDFTFVVGAASDGEKGKKTGRNNGHRQTKG